MRQTHQTPLTKIGIEKLPGAVAEEYRRGGFSSIQILTFENGHKIVRKIFDPGPGIYLDQYDKLRERFRREVEIQQSLPHNLFLPVYDTDLTGDHPWFTMPLADKTYEQQIADDRTANSTSLEPLYDILEGLEYLHAKGYVHRDVKPSNVLLHEGKWKLSDFGLVRITQEDKEFTTERSTWGSKPYEAPEQVQSFKDVGFHADIYAFGCVLHDLFDGSERLPYVEQTAEGPIGGVIERCTRTQPKNRFASVAHLRLELDRAFESPDYKDTIGEPGQWAIELGPIEKWNEDLKFNVIRTLRDDHASQFREALFDRLNVDDWQSAKLGGEEFFEQLVESFIQRGGDELGSYSASDRWANVAREIVAMVEGASLRAKIIVSIALVAERYNRWHVMEVLHALANNGLDDTTAHRVGMLIGEQNAYSAFRTCASQIGKKVSDYHWRIRSALDAELPFE